ncbi:MAG TPA: hypothetical protein VK464_19840 [Symbiobacteriaceae bacterium]|jgi:hypothetical protein|nr:hypothetical protein [Symbiobacteriaceae bacterium]
MICHFRSGVQPARPATAHPPSAVDDAAARQVLLALLDRLRGRPVTLLLRGGGTVSGRLVATSPVTLISDDGRSTVVAESISSVAF